MNNRGFLDYVRESVVIYKTKAILWLLTDFDLIYHKVKVWWSEIQ